MVCRPWGTAGSMPCRHGCAPESGLLDDAAAMGLLASSLQAGGHRDTALGQLLAVCRDDPAASAMLSARTGRDRTVEPARRDLWWSCARPGSAEHLSWEVQRAGRGRMVTGPASPVAISARTSGRVS